MGTQPRRGEGGGDGSRRVGGLHAVETAIIGGADRVRRLLADPRRRDARMRRTLEQARKAGITVERMPGQRISEWLGDDRHQGIAAEVAGSGILDERALLARIGELDHPPFLLALDGVQDPHNLGACLRSAEAAGADAVIIPRDRAARLTPTVERAAAGAAERITLAAVTNLARTLERLREAGCWVIGTAGEEAEDLYAVDLTGPLVLVCGGEADGLRQRTRAMCDRLVAIPLVGKTESLNVSVAAGVCLFEALRQRRSGDVRQ
jgi:23S rRNA (guanosine2251-2'-O)-methyltransferase